MEIKSAKLKVERYRGFIAPLDKDIQERVNQSIKEALERIFKKIDKINTMGFGSASGAVALQQVEQILKEEFEVENAL